MRILLFLLLYLPAGAQTAPKLYRPGANAELELKSVLAQAKKDRKHVLVQVGSNSCTWCYRLHRTVEGDTVLKNLVQYNYYVYHLNSSSENPNRALLEAYGFPQRFGFPVLLVLDGSGTRLHTQDATLLEAGPLAYDRKKLKAFLESWAPSALNPVYYKD